MAEAIHFGTDGWRAIIGEDFTEENLVRAVCAAAQIFQEERDANPDLADVDTLIIGHDCRQNAHAYAQLAAAVAAAAGFTVKLSRDYCPTPALCWSVAQDPRAIGGIMLTSSH
ncbi:MAG: phosphoglucomutase/phosphomannomutase family protein, partial [Ruthenibacterium sp.]